MRGWLMASVVTIAVGACAPADSDDQAATTPNTADDVAAISRLRDAWQAAWKAGNTAGIAAMYTADAHDMTNYMPTNVGPQAVQAGLDSAFSRFAPTDIVLTSEKVEVEGDLAYDRGTFKLTMTPKAGGTAVVDSGRYLVVLRRQADGSWKLSEGMGNSATPLPMPPTTPVRTP